MGLVRVRAAPVSANKAPPPAARVTARALVMLALASSVPPLKVNPPEGSPSSASLSMVRKPWDTVQGVTAVVVPLRVQSLVPVFSKVPKPW